MNQRIKELKHQASLWCDQNIPEQYSEETNSYGTAWEDKFAELIVRECVSIIAKRKDSAIERGWNVDEAMSMAALDIEGHFGVEVQ